MENVSVIERPVEALALLQEPTRRRLYDLVAASPTAIGRDDAAIALGIGRELAAFHLDRLLEAGLLATEYRRRTGRSGPGAGRPAKLYRRSGRDLAVSFPPRTYDLAADLLATAIERLDPASGSEAVSAVARERGSVVGKEARRMAGARPGRRRLLEALMDVLRRGGYEPRIDASNGTLSLFNCPFDALASAHRELTCGMNLAWAKGVLDGLASRASVELAPEPGRCCAVFFTAPTGTHGRATRDPGVKAP